MYYLTVTQDAAEIIHKQPFSDYAVAIEYIGRFYRPRVPGSRVTLPLVTEVVNGVFARSFGSLTRPESITDSARDVRYHDAAQQSVAFLYEASYTFLIESESGIQDTADLLKQYEDDE